MDANIQRLQELAERNGYAFTIENGQLIYGPPRLMNSYPSKDSEVFVGKLPKEMDLSALVRTFNQVGRIYTLRIMVNFSGVNRGFAFVQYSTENEANRAIEMLHDFEIVRGHRIGVTVSKNNCRLYVGKIDQSLSRQEIEDFFKRETKGVSNIYLHREQGQQYGYGFIDYESHRDAAKSRRLLKPARTNLGRFPLTVDWANSSEEVHPINNSSDISNSRTNSFNITPNSRDASLSTSNLNNNLSSGGHFDINQSQSYFNQNNVSRLSNSNENNSRFFGNHNENWRINRNANNSRFNNRNEDDLRFNNRNDNNLRFNSNRNEDDLRFNNRNEINSRFNDPINNLESSFQDLRVVTSTPNKKTTVSGSANDNLNVILGLKNVKSTVPQSELERMMSANFKLIVPLIKREGDLVLMYFKTVAEARRVIDAYNANEKALLNSLTIMCAEPFVSCELICKRGITFDNNNSNSSSSASGDLFNNDFSTMSINANFLN